MLIAALGLASACKRARVQISAASSASAAAPALGSLRVVPSQYDFGTLIQGEVASAKFELDNTGTAELELESTTDALGCHGTIAPASLAAGAKAELAVECRAKYYGPLALSLPIRAVGGATLLGEIKLTGKVTPLLAFDPPFVSSSLPFGAERSTTVHLAGTLASAAKLTFKDDSDAGFQIEALPADAHGPVVRLTLKGKKVGTHVGNIVGTTNLEQPREIRLAYSCEVTGNLRVAPSTLYFDLRAPGGDTKEIVVSSSEPEFRLQQAEIAEGPFEASFARDGESRDYRVSLSLRRDRVTGDARGTLGRLVLHSNDRAEPEKEVSLFALGAAN
ncbi:MAG TPA: hypothetical protein VHV51_00655 [Polyangiaceae bacterium]|nr:hypothetical protein [Polyangiaceae bacterium]